MIDTVKIGEFLTELRKEKNMNQQQLASLLNVTHQAVSKWETGQALPDMPTMLILSKLYGLSIEEILMAERRESVQSAPASSKASEETPQKEEQDELAASLDEESDGQAKDDEPVQDEPIPTDYPDMDEGMLSGMLPFLDEQVVDHMVQQAVESKAYGKLVSFMPFASEDACYLAFETVVRAGSMTAVAIAPFLTDEDRTLDIVKRYQPSRAMLSSLFPFLPGNGRTFSYVTSGMPSGIGKMVSNALKNVRGKKSGASDDQPSRLVARLRDALARGDDEVIEEYADDLDADDLYTLLKEAAEKGWDAVLLIGAADEDIVLKVLKKAAKADDAATVKLIAEHID